MYLALIEPGSYLDFANPVPFSDTDGVIERGVLNEDGRISGRAQAAVRPLSPGNFNRIIALGLKDGEPLLPRVGTLCRLTASTKSKPILSLSRPASASAIYPRGSCEIAFSVALFCAPIASDVLSAD